MDYKPTSFPNSVWGCVCGRNFVTRGGGCPQVGAARRQQTPPPAKQSFAPKCVPKQSLGTRRAECGFVGHVAVSSVSGHRTMRERIISRILLL